MDRELTLVEHLEELRRRAIVSLSWLAGLSVLSFPAASRVMKALMAPASGSVT